MKMIDNYLSSLESYLPDEIKEDIRDEFEASIYDQFEERQELLNRDLTQDEQEDLLVKIGHPMQVAARYLPNQKLIGESFFPAYKKALKLAILIVFSIKILLVLPTVMSNGNIVQSGFSLLFGLVDTSFWVFTYVTGIFYLMESFGFDSKHLYSFSAKDLRASNPKLALSRLEGVFELIFLVLFLGWWNNLFSWIPIAINTIPFLKVSMTPEWLAVFWSVNIVLGFDLLNCLYKLVRGNYTRITLFIGMILDVASIAIIYQISKFSKFVTIAESDKTDLDWTKLEPIININVYIILAVILAISLWDIVSSVKKLRYF
jgi:hypothetical protein